MDRADGIDQGALDVDGLRVFRRLDGRFQVARVVEGVEDADDVDTVIDGAVDEFVDDVVGIMAVALFWPRNNICKGVFLTCFLMVRRRSHGSSSRKRIHVSKVAPPQHSRAL